jgi:hypothetical protein
VITPIQTPVEVPVLEPIEGYEPYDEPPPEETKQGVDVPSKAKGRELKREAKRLPGESLYSVAFTYGRGGETRTVSAKSYEEAYAKASRTARTAKASQVRIVKI